MEHPDPDVLLRFLLCTASRPENRQVVRHLLARCPSCAETLRMMKPPPVDPAEHDEAIDRAAAFLRELTRKTEPPRRPVPVDAEADLLPGTGATGTAARRRWLFG